MKIDIFNTDRKYSVIYADPPWRYSFSKSDNRKIENQYNTMTISELCDMNIPSAEDSVLFLWATAPKICEALQVMTAWGFKYKTCACWDKKTIGMGYLFRCQHELLLVGVKGQFSPPKQSDRIPSVYSEKKTKHSKKPYFFRDYIGRVFNGEKIELFARESVDGWDCWGNEV